jgi:hypothetical protein
MGFSNNVLYQLAGTESFRAVTSGHNQYFYASEYWSPCCGLGSPNGNKLIEMVKSLEPSN